ncbi:gastrula zinc finger protein xFG20-1-like [Sardina pilchardus]|uniref:gastrula zinc finger protein xFG20-1-like n=1 Tax=Sardina pilchardus TaxID=27697 RepID=UPI002E12A730
MIHKCAVTGCPNRSDSIIHYTLPEEESRRLRWIQFMERGGKEMDASALRICGSHFTEDSFTKLDLGFTTRLILSVNAVPTIYPEDLLKLQKESHHPPLEDGKAGEGYVKATETLSPDFWKRFQANGALDEDDMTEEPAEDDFTDEPGEDEMEDEMTDEMAVAPFNLVKVEPQHEDGYGDSPFEQHKTVHMNSSLKQYNCAQCGRNFSHKAFLKAHEKIHASVETEMAFSCTMCDRRFTKKSGLKKHMHNHLARLNYPCPVCGEEFELKGSLHNHVKSHPGERFRCKYCDQGFLKIDAYMRHVDRHTVVTPYYCEKCKIYQLTERGFLLHKKRHERDELEQKQSENKTVVVRKGGRPKKNLAQIQNLPQEEPQVGAEISGPNLTLQPLTNINGTLLKASGGDPSHETTNPSDEAEMEEEHTSPEDGPTTGNGINGTGNGIDGYETEMLLAPIEDELNDEPFNIVKVEPQDLNRFTKQFPAEESNVLKPYHCYQCGRNFTHKAFLKTHQKVHASVETHMAFSCTKCDRRFSKKSELNKHMHNHLERPNYPCPVCGEEFEIKGSLHNHVKSHPGERFRCKYCDQRFLKIDPYLKHVDRHTVVTPYYCEKCKVYQLTERGFLIHQRAHAREELEPRSTKPRPALKRRRRRRRKSVLMTKRPIKTVGKPQVGSEVPEPKLTLQSHADTNGTRLEFPSHETTGRSAEAEMEQEEEEEEEEEEEQEEQEEEEEEQEEEEQEEQEEEMSPEDETSDGSQKESTD